jgi:hypothetical protein
MPYIKGNGCTGSGVSRHAREPRHTDGKVETNPSLCIDISSIAGNLICCGKCGASVTAEHKRNRKANEYIYYHCTHGKKGVTCRERSIEERELERQIIHAFDRGRADGEALCNADSLRNINSHPYRDQTA